MSIRTILSAGAGLSMALIAAPASALHAQTSQDSAADRVYRTNVPRYPTNPAARATVQVVADSTFVREARQGSLFEVRAGTLAGLKASNPAVKQFASRMVSDHTKLGDQWSALGDRLGAKSKPELDAMQNDAMSRFRTVTGADFDRTYMTEMVQDHQKDLAAFQQMAQQGQSPELRQLASTSVTTIQQHLTQAQQVAGQVGTGAVATNVPSSTPAPANQPRVTSQGGRATASELRPDRDYIDKVDQDLVTQVRLAQVAQPKLKDSKVRQFAKNMEDDLRPRRDRWDALASEAGLSDRNRLPPNTVSRLKSAAPNEVDRIYLNLVTDNLTSLISSLENQGPNAHTTRVRDLAKDQINDLKQHLSRAQDLARQHKQK